MQDNLVDDFDYDTTKEAIFCEPCANGKHHRSWFPTRGAKRAEEPLGLVHSDVCGKMGEKLLSGSEYFLTFIDDKTRHVWVYILKHKYQVFERFLEWKALVERSTGRKLKALRTDNGGEFTSTEFKDYLKREGIRHELSVPKTPEQNGVAERLNQTLVESVRSMLSYAKLPQKFWAEAAVYLRNRITTKAVTGMTPFEAWSGEKPGVGHLRAFGCAANAHVTKDERKKLDAKAKKFILLGYGTETKGYRQYDASRARVIHSRDVLFDESTRGVEIPRDCEVGIREENQENRCVELGSLGDEEPPSEEEPASDEGPVVDQGTKYHHIHNKKDASPIGMVSECLLQVENQCL